MDVDVEWINELLKRLSRLWNYSYFGGGPNGTCYECPYASPPLERDGREALWREISNDPTEAYYRCSLPLRVPEKEVEWGEYAPCTEKEWERAHMGMLRKALEGK
jgi:hypothetical protein